MRIPAATILPTLPAIVALIIAGLFAVVGNAQASPAHYRVVGYATGWNPLQDKDAGKIDTLIFAFAQLQQGRVTLDAARTQRLRQLITLKAAHPRLTVEISVGGWRIGGFSDAAATEAGRRVVADSAAQLVAEYDADGLDVDWEYPGHHESGIQSSPQDRANFTLLLQAIRASLDRVGAAHDRTSANHYTLSIAAADGPFVSGIDLAAVAPSLDWFNLMTYDFVNAMTPTTGHHSGLHASKLAPADARSTSRAVHQCIAAGVPARKLVIGAAFYGREFAGVQAAHHALYQRYDHFQGILPWPQLKADYIGKQGYVRYRDATAQASWLWNARTRSFISYDDPQSIAAKTAFVKAHHLGGVMYWEQSLDPSNELLDAIWQGLQ